MIKVILKGGLGNQMFQYALGKSLALQNRVPLFLDLSFLKYKIPFKSLSPLKDFTYRDYNLDIFNLEEKTGTIFNNEVLDKHFSYPVTMVYNKLFNKHYLEEGSDPYNFNKEILGIGGNAVLNGFWNNYKYFLKHENEIRDTFDTGKLFDPKYEDLERTIHQKENSVAVHIRRGDYLNKKHKNVYIQLDEYFKKAANLVKNKIDAPYFFIFSDADKKELGDVLNLEEKEYEVVDKKASGYKNKTHFRLMTLCNHIITCNSTYSWWAGFLNKSPNKIVVAPSRWMRKYSFDNVESWQVIEV